MAIRAFELQDQIFEWFANDAQLLALLGNPATPEALNNKFRREVCGMDEVEGCLDFINFYFLPSGGRTGNYKVNRNSLFVDFFCAFRNDAIALSERVNEIIEGNSNEEILMSSEGQLPSGITGVYLYRQKYMPLVRG